jgi:cytochrome c biogenesis protein CcdA
MTIGLVAVILGIAVVDSVNPSALAMTGYLLTLESPWSRIRAYVAGIFALYLALGLLVVFALGDGIARLIETLSDPGVGYGVQAAVGLAAVVFAVRSPRAARAGSTPPVATDGRAFALGLTITAVEATTALPYLGALALLARSDASAAAASALLVAYCLIFVAPPSVLAAIAYRRREDVSRWRASRASAAPGRGRAVLRVLCGVVGVVLLVDSGLYFATGDGLF